MQRGDKSAALQMSLERLAARHFDLSQAEDGVSQSIASDDQHTEISPWGSLSISCRAQSLLSVLINFRDAEFSLADAMLGKPDADLRADPVIRTIANVSRMTRPAGKEDPTLFSKLRREYQNIVEDLLLQDSTNDLCLREFQILHNAGHFLCRFKDCPRAYEGFDNFELRQQHEDRHTPRFKCNEPSCGWICKNQRAWRRHMEKYHESTKQAEIPSSLGIPRDLDDRSGASTPTPSTPITPTTSTPIPPTSNLPEEEDLNEADRRLTDYQMQLMLLEQQNEKRRLQASQEREEKIPVSSYWSVPETVDFINYVERFGTDWDLIAQLMKTKTTKMLRNHYQRELEPKKGEKGRELERKAWSIKPAIDGRLVVPKTRSTTLTFSD